MAKKANNQEVEENKILENKETNEENKTIETDKIVENEEIVINKNDIIPEKEVRKDDVIEVETSEVIIENNSNKEIKLVDLEVKIPFTDKYDETKEYVVGDIIQVNEERAKELLEDKRNLVVLTSK